MNLTFDLNWTRLWCTWNNCESMLLVHCVTMNSIHHLYICSRAQSSIIVWPWWDGNFIPVHFSSSFLQVLNSLNIQFIAFQTIVCARDVRVTCWNRIVCAHSVWFYSADSFWSWMESGLSTDHFCVRAEFDTWTYLALAPILWLENLFFKCIWMHLV